MKNNHSFFAFGVFLFSAVVGIMPQSFVFADENATTSVSITLDIESATSTLWSGPLTVAPCAASASSTLVASGYCAVIQSGLESSWSSFGGAKFLDSVSGNGSDYANNLYWGWFSNLEYGQTSLDQHVLAEGERLLVTLGRMPLKIAVSTTTPSVGSNVNVTVSQFGFDDSWNGVWLSAASSSLNIAGQVNAVPANGSFDINIGTSTPFSIFATKSGFVTSPTVLISPFSNAQSTTTASTTVAAIEGGTVLGGSGSNRTSCSFDISNALRFLISKQKSDGSFGLGLYTDWAAIALASAPDTSERRAVFSYIKNSVDSLSSATDYERHAMVLMALGINPYNGTSVNYIQKIVDRFDGTQIGDSSLVNDDVFAIFPLMNAGFSAQDLIIQKTIAFIVSKQESNGSWKGSVDMTAVALQALSLVPSASGVDQAIRNSKVYLLSHQGDDGGFGSSFTTSWVIQAIAALGDSSSAWVKNGNGPQDALCRAQQTDGGLEPVTSDDSSRLWATSYAIPAALNRSWSSILSSFSKQALVDGVQKQSDTTSSEIVLATTSPAVILIATTTEPVIPVVPLVPFDTAVHTEPIDSPAESPAVASVSVIDGPLGTSTADGGSPPQLAAVASSGGEFPLKPIMAVAAGLSGSLIALYLFKFATIF